MNSRRPVNSTVGSLFIKPMAFKTKLICLVVCVIPAAFLALGLLVPCGRIALYCQLGGLLGWFILPYSFLSLAVYPRSEFVFFILGLIQYPIYVLLWYLFRRLTRHGFVVGIAIAGMHSVIAVICFMLMIKFTG
jgi:hypothetical protein